MTATLLRADTRADLSSVLSGFAGRTALVPTMGALHEGHLTLIRHAREQVGADGAVVVSIFVNPTQFAPGEDLERYPRTLEADLAGCAGAGADIAFTPSVDEMYPAGLEGGITVDPGHLGTILEGASRPTHFRGVLTVVAKLFGLVGPDVAVFGQKDYQQLALIRLMAAELCLPVDVVGAETVREPDGLALSSRNRYLDDDQRREAAVLSRALFAARADSDRGAEAALAAARAELRTAKLADLDYLEITGPDLGPAPSSGEARMLVAARLGSTRLIDNIALTL